MKQKKLVLKDIKGLLSKEEMKKIVAGSDGGCCGTCKDNNVSGYSTCYWDPFASNCRCVYGSDHTCSNP